MQAWPQSSRRDRRPLGRQDSPGTVRKCDSRFSVPRPRAVVIDIIRRETSGGGQSPSHSCRCRGKRLQRNRPDSQRPQVHTARMGTGRERPPGATKLRLCYLGTLLVSDHLVESLRNVASLDGHLTSTGRVIVQKRIISPEPHTCADVSAYYKSFSSVFVGQQDTG